MTSVKPEFSEVVALVRREYGIEVEKVKKLEGYIDKNMWLRSIDGKEYVLRIKIQQLDVKLVQMETEGLEHLHGVGFQVPLPIQTQNGGTHAKYLVANGAEISDASFPVQLMPFIPGNTVYYSEFTEEELYVLSRNIGAYGGLMQECLNGLNSKHRARRDDFHIWYTENFVEVGELLDYVKDEDLRMLMRNFIQGFEKNVLPKLSCLRQAFVHGDYSNTNIVVVNAGRATTAFLSRDQLLTDLGAIDFEYYHHGYLVFSLTVCMAYMMAQAAHQGADPLRVAREVLLGYTGEFPLSQDELGVVFWGVVARLTTSTAMAARQVAVGVDDEEYVTSQSRYGPGLLRLLASQGDKVVNKWIEGRSNGVTLRGFCLNKN